MELKSLNINNKTVYVSMCGKVFNDKNKELNQYDNGTGYLSVSVSSKLYYVHRLVGLCFIGDFREMQINHKDGNRKNNNYENLEWVTRSDNQKHAYRILKRKHPKSQLGKDGYLHHKSKEIISQDINGSELCRYGSIRHAAKEIGVTHQAIMAVLKGRRKLVKGLKFVYAKT